MIQLELPFPTCEIQWCNHRGEPTPDSNYSIGIATVSGVIFVKRDYHICKEHAKQLAGLPNWSFRPIK